MPSSNDEPPLLPLDARFAATICCVVAIVLAFLLTLEPPTRAGFIELIDLLLGLYVTYSVVLCLAVHGWRPVLPDILEHTHFTLQIANHGAAPAPFATAHSQSPSPPSADTCAWSGEATNPLEWSLGAH
jgi:hypothetical protein